MTKKIFILLILLFIFVLNPVFAANDIDMNLSSDNTATSDANNSSTNTTTNTDTNNATNESSTNTQTNSSNSISNSNYSSTVGSYLPEAELGLNNILNILLIVVGVLLILLSIAILIRLKN